MTKISSLNHFFKCLGGLALGLIFYIFFITVFNKSLADYDLWGYLSFGRLLWEEGFFPYQDVFAYTPTKPLWVYHEWLTGVVFFCLVKYWGPESLQLIRYLSALLTVYLVCSAALKKGGSLSNILMIIIPSVLLISFGYVPVRAQIFTFLFFILTLYILEYSKKTESITVLRWLPVIQIFWCNFHGGFVSGLGLIFLYALGEGLARKKIAVVYLKWGMIASLATLINPYGIDYWIYTVHAVFMPRPEITEWYSAATALKSKVYTFPVTLFLVMSFIMIFFSFLRKKKDITELLVIAVVVYWGTAHVRHGIFLGLIFGAYMPAYLSEYVDAGGSGKKSFKFLINFLPVIFSSLLIIIYFYVYPIKQINFAPSFRFAVVAGSYPTKAIDWMKNNHIKGNILPHFEWGEYLIWSCYPDCRVAMDGRYETVYQSSTHKEYFDFSYGRNNWDIFLKKYPHDIVLLKAGTKIHSLMIHEKDWHIVYYDNISVLFMKKNSAHKL